MEPTHYSCNSHLTRILRTYQKNMYSLLLTSICMTWMRLGSLVIGLLESVAFHLNNTILRLFHDILLKWNGYV